MCVSDLCVFNTGHRCFLNRPPLKWPEPKQSQWYYYRCCCELSQESHERNIALKMAHPKALRIYLILSRVGETNIVTELRARPMKLSALGQGCICHNWQQSLKPEYGPTDDELDLLLAGVMLYKQANHPGMTIPSCHSSRMVPMAPWQTLKKLLVPEQGQMEGPWTGIFHPWMQTEGITCILEQLEHENRHPSNQSSKTNLVA